MIWTAEIFFPLPGMPTYKPVDEFLDLARSLPVIDVRAPSEFQQGHIPGAANMPLFDDQQRVEIGKLYKQTGRQESILRALEIVGPKMQPLVGAVLKIVNRGEFCLYCWRGGMRSRSVAWLTEQVDLRPQVLQGGYKSFRRHVLQSFKKPIDLVVLSGLTGAGKTRQIQLLQQCGEQVIDLESLANHRGSAFGGIGLGAQPSVEHFENLLFEAISKLEPDKRIWVEDESRSIGSVRIPHHFFDRIRSAPGVFMEVSREVRRRLIAQEYGALAESELIASAGKITRRMGGQNVKAAVQAIQSGNLNDSIDILLDYYDKTYLANKTKMKRKVFVDVVVEDPVSEVTTRHLIEVAAAIAVDSRQLAGRF